MDDSKTKREQEAPESTDELSRFAEQYRSFNRVINSLQRKYLELKDEYSTQNVLLADANRRLLEFSERSLAATEFLDGVLGSLSAGVIAVDTEGHITHINPFACQLLGVDRPAVRGKHYRQAFGWIEGAGSASQSVATGRTVQGVERTCPLSDGRTAVLSVSTCLLTDKRGDCVGAVEVFHDVSGIKIMEAEVTRLTTLATLGEMAATVAHQVRTPLAGIGGFAQLLERDMPETDPRRKLIGKIIRGVDNLNNTVTSLLNYSRVEKLNLEEVDAVRFVTACIDQFRHDYGDRLNGAEIEVVTSPQNELPLKVDRMLLREVFFNLFLNSIEAADGSAIVYAEIRRLNRDEIKALGGQSPLALQDSVIEITLMDSGPGIPEEHREKIFTPFYTTKQSGNGLGLAVAWKIVRAHGGDVLAENAEAGGAVFRILLPAMTTQTEMESPL
ncbi:MAG: ATP-binding protein [Candidatus Zixiibacteriota bacterium]